MSCRLSPEQAPNGSRGWITEKVGYGMPGMKAPFDTEFDDVDKGSLVG